MNASAKLGLAAVMALSLVGVAGGAAAQEKCRADNDCKGGKTCQSGACVLSIREIVIVGRVQKPVASLDVNKIQPKLALSEFPETFLSRVEDVVKKDPF